MYKGDLLHNFLYIELCNILFIWNDINNMTVKHVYIVMIYSVMH